VAALIASLTRKYSDFAIRRRRFSSWTARSKKILKAAPKTKCSKKYETNCWACAAGSFRSVLQPLVARRCTVQGAGGGSERSNTGGF